MTQAEDAGRPDHTTRQIAPIAAFDIFGGQSTPVTADWPALAGDGDYRWLHLDLNDPNVAEWSRDHLPRIADRALRQSETRPRCDRFEDGLILNLRGVNLNPNSSPEDMVSLRMWVTPRAIVSARLRKVWALDDMRTRIEKGDAPQDIGAFLAALTFGLSTRIEKVSLDLEAQTDDLEDQMLDGARPKPSQISSLRHAVIKMRRFVGPQREAISTLGALDSDLMSSDDAAQIRESANLTRRIVEELDATRDRLTALQEHIDAERTQALSRNSYLLSIVAAVFLPLGFLTGLFGVNIAGMPGTTDPAAFWILTGVSMLSGVILLIVFKLARWL